jgi:class 3 adenylate cyclase
LTDIVDSVGMWDRAPDAMSYALVRHDCIVRREIIKRRGHVFGTAGDAFAAAFACAEAALEAATAIQRRLHREDWPATAPISVRTALHSGEALERGGNYYGRSVNVAARLAGLAYGGQVLMSSATKDLVDGALTEAVTLVCLGPQRLRGVGSPVWVWGVEESVSACPFRPLRAATSVAERELAGVAASQRQSGSGWAMDV